MRPKRKLGPWSRVLAIALGTAVAVLLALNFGGHGCGQLGVVFFDGNAF